MPGSDESRAVTAATRAAATSATRSTPPLGACRLLRHRHFLDAAAVYPPTSPHRPLAPSTEAPARTITRKGGSATPTPRPRRPRASAAASGKRVHDGPGRAARPGAAAYSPWRTRIARAPTAAATATSLPGRSPITSSRSAGRPASRRRRADPRDAACGGPPAQRSVITTTGSSGGEPGRGELGLLDQPGCRRSGRPAGRRAASARRRPRTPGYGASRGGACVVNAATSAGQQPGQVVGRHARGEQRAVDRAAGVRPGGELAASAAATPAPSRPGQPAAAPTAAAAPAR